MKYLFGPVPSRRLGRSLGVDLVPTKTCTFDCIYCEVGPTTHLTKKRQAFEVAAIIQELTSHLPQLEGRTDVITLAGSGEPTLNLGLETIIAAVKGLTSIPVAVLTNGSLLFLAEVRQALAGADVVLPSLDTAHEETFRRLNRPHPGLSLAHLLDGLQAFRREFPGRIWLEIMLLQGLNDQEKELAALKEAINKIAPDKIQLNTAVRPVVEDYAQALSRQDLEAVAAFLGGPVEVIASFDGQAEPRLSLPDRNFLEMLSRRPMTARHLAQVSGLPLAQVEKRLQRLEAGGFIRVDRHQEERFYRGTAQARTG